MPGSGAVERAIDKVRFRDWETVREQWLAYVPDITPSGSPPVLPLASVPGLAEYADAAANKRTIRISGEQNALRISLLWEGIYVLHKASHVIAAAGLQANQGLCTWSLSSFYQGGLFAAKAVLSLMGLGFPEFKGKTLLVDIWPEESPEQRRLRKRGFVPPPEAQLTHVPSRFDHHATWYALLRLVRTCRADIWPAEYVSALRLMKVGQMSDQRNAIHYRPAYWTFDDLHSPQSIIEFFHLERDANGSIFVEPEREDFSLVLAVIVLHMALLLFDSLQQLTKDLGSEFALVRSALQGDNHLIYRRAVNAAAAWSY